MNSPKSTSPKKPSPLGYGSSPRTSPFKRQSSPSPAPTSPAQAAPASPATPLSYAHADIPAPLTPTPRSHAPRPLPNPATYNQSPRQTPTTPSSAKSASKVNNADPTARLHPAALREMRECFSVLDRDSKGTLSDADVVEALSQIGAANGSADIAPYFAHGAPVTLPWFLASMSGPMSEVSSPHELAAAFSAFDKDDSGQVDVGELREALRMVNSSAGEEGGRGLSEGEVDDVVREFCGRRAFGRGVGMGKSGDVFRYREFISALTGGGGREGQSQGVMA
ncbi:MAG: hypothetical protein Q9162_000089 [Coniocarpon cinnabarinum]